MQPQRSLVPSVCSLNTEEETAEYGHIQRKLQGYKEVLRMIQKNDDGDRRNLFSRRSSNNSCYNTDILQLTESQEDEADQGFRVSQLEQQVHSLQKELAAARREQEKVANHRDQLLAEVQALRAELEGHATNPANHHKSFINNTLLDITYEQENTQDYGRRRIKSLKQTVLEERRIIDEIAELLQTENIVREVQNLQNRVRKQEKFINCIQDMVNKLTPKNLFQADKPSLRECWKWIKRVLNEFMSQRAILQTLSKQLNVTIEQIPQEVKRIIRIINRPYS